MSSRNPKDDLRVPNEFDATRTGMGERGARRRALNMRAAHNTFRVLQFDQTISILRYTRTGGSPQRGVSPTPTLVTGMADLPAHVGDFRTRVRIIDGEKVKEIVRAVVLYNVPEWTNAASNLVARVLLTDRIDYDGDTYDVLEVDASSETGRHHIIMELRSI